MKSGSASSVYDRMLSDEEEATMEHTLPIAAQNHKLKKVFFIIHSRVVVAIPLMAKLDLIFLSGKVLGKDFWNKKGLLHC